MLDRLCAAAAEAFARAMVHGVLAAIDAPDCRAYRDVWPVSRTEHDRPAP